MVQFANPLAYVTFSADVATSASRQWSCMTAVARSRLSNTLVSLLLSARRARLAGSAEIAAANLLIDQDRRAGVFEQDLSQFQGHPVMRDRQRLPGVLFDHEHGDAGA